MSKNKLDEGELGFYVNDHFDLTTARIVKFIEVLQKAWVTAIGIEKNKSNPIVEVAPGMWRRKYKRGV